MAEFQLIEWLRSQQSNKGQGVTLGIGDDGAVLRISPNQELVISTDTLNEGVHFDKSIAADDLGYKALAVNLSDLAAMGASPAWALLSLSMPFEDRAWFEAFSSGFLNLASEHGVSLVGGDTCGGGLSIGVTVLGTVNTGHAITRSGAHSGDLVVVSGTLGDAALAFSRLQALESPAPTSFNALYRPVPRVALGQSLVGKASSCIDISDGLLADLGHIADASNCGAKIEIARLPVSRELSACNRPERSRLQLSGGEDYELCFSISPGKRDVLDKLEKELNIQLTVIGEITPGSGVECIDHDGCVMKQPPRGFEHFK